MHQKVDISTSTFIRLILVLLGLWFLYYIRDVLVLLFIVVILVASLEPTVDRWAKKITRPGAVVSIFLLLTLALVGIFSLIVPPLVSQMQQFSHNLPDYAASFSRHTQDPGLVSTISNFIGKNLNTLSSQLGNFGQAVLNQAVGVINGVVAVVTVFILSFYLLLDEEGLRRAYTGLVPGELRGAFAETTKKILRKLGGWLRGHLLVMLIVGISTAIGLLIIGSPYALTLGIWAGIAELVPIVGPWIGGIPGVAVGLAQSPIQGFLTLLVYLLVQQLESNFLVPRVMAKVVGLSPVVVIIALLVGGKVYGVMGVLLAVPAAAAISVILEDWPLIKDLFSKARRA